jgi:uncharacterized protein YcfL
MKLIKTVILITGVLVAGIACNSMAQQTEQPLTLTETTPAHHIHSVRHEKQKVKHKDYQSKKAKARLQQNKQQKMKAKPVKHKAFKEKDKDK